MKLFVLVGGAVGKSLSPAMHNAAFAAAGVDARYEAWDVPGPQAAGLEQLFRAGGHGAADGPPRVAGLNVTVPHKTAAAALCDELSGEARLAGAVNTVVFSGPDRRAAGHNTDVVALAAILSAWPGGRDRVAILGAGGAARAAAVAAATSGAREVVLSSRRPERAQEVAAELAQRLEAAAGAGQAEAKVVLRGAGLDDLARSVFESGYDVVIQATSAPDGALGRLRSRPGGGSEPGGPPRRLAIELNYRPLRTRFLAEAEAAGARTVDGLEVLLRQGEGAFRLFTGREAPPGVMRRALLEVQADLPGVGGGRDRC